MTACRHHANTRRLSIPEAKFDLTAWREDYERTGNSPRSTGQDPDIPAVPADHVVPRQLPLPVSAFVGRVTELDVLDDSLTVPAPMVVIGGAGGIGKTSLALHWAHRNADRFPDGHLFVDLHGFSPDSRPLNPQSAVRGFLTALGVSPERVPADADAQAALYRSEIAGKRMLILLDNAASTDQVVPLLPGTTTCCVLVTSRNKLAALIDRYGARHLQLDTLHPDEAHALLTRRLGSARVAAEPHATGDLIRLCGYYPFALAIMARHAHTRPHIPLSEFVAELGDLGLAALDNEDPTASLPTVLSWSLRGLSTEQHTVFALLSITPGVDIGLPAAASLTGLPVQRTRDTLRVLEDASLLDRHAHGRYAMHDLIRDYATAAARRMDDRTRDAALRRVVDFYIHTALAGLRFLAPAHARQIRLEPPAAGTHLHPIPDAEAALAWFNTEHLNLLAADLLERVLATIGPHDPSREVLLVALVRVLFRLTRNPEAQARQALTASTDPARTEELRQLLAAIVYRNGRRDEAIRTLTESTVDDLVPEAWRQRRKSLLAHLRRDVSDVDEAEVDAKAEYAEAVRDGDDYLAAHALQTRWLVDSIRRDHEAALRHVDAAIAMVRGSPELADKHVNLLDNRLFTLQNLDRIADADATLRTAAALVTDHRLPVGPQVSAAVHHYWTGRWDDALLELRTITEDGPAITYSGLMDAGPEGLLLHGVSALIAGRRDDRATVAANLDAAEKYSLITESARENCDFLLVARAVAAMQRGDALGALTELAPVLDPAYAEMMLRHQWLPDVVRLALEVHDTERVDEALAVAEMEAARERVPARAQAALHRCQALITGDPEPALTAVSHYRSVGRSVELASALAEAATLLAKRDLPRDAAVAYEEAMRSFASLGAHWDMARTVAHMSRLGISEPKATAPPDRPSPGGA
ncbi:ATP-binding protein [Actinosynnema sp. ALI-1.44]|uniref:ATP-binding protein n=1 Tax=Actinosynnema sp. ALI-1.44 TaxID=1933779 RepID=UPI001EDAEFB6|nr:NB-ARC domain-containing protein [Actinosynnema sp. ALI-1.44]